MAFSEKKIFEEEANRSHLNIYLVAIVIVPDWGILAIYLPIIFTAPDVMFLMRADYEGKGGGRLGLGNRDLFGPCEMTSSR